MEYQVCGSSIAIETRFIISGEVPESQLRFPALLLFCKMEQEKRSMLEHCVNFSKHCRLERKGIRLVK